MHEDCRFNAQDFRSAEGWVESLFHDARKDVDVVVIVVFANVVNVDWQSRSSLARTVPKDDVSSRLRVRACVVRFIP